MGKILDANCTLKGLDPTGAVSDGYITVTGQTRQAVVQMSGRSPGQRLPISATQQYYSVIGLESLDSDSESGSWSTCSSDTEGEDIGEPPYFYTIKDEATGIDHPFLPDSASDLGVVKSKHTVTLLLWSFQKTLISIPGPGGPLAFTCFVLRPVEGKRDTYTRLGLFQFRLGEVEDVSEVNCAEVARSWFGDTPEQKLVIV